ncbi:MAG: rRNA (Uracil-5-)-methyltransferase [Chlamydiota bacterium]|jgi:23S rRNA (uracil1939-C5)-methyltransferase
MKPSVGDTLQLHIERLGIYGEGVARHNGFTLFVDGALPGELVAIQVTEVRSTFGRAKLIKILQSSPHWQTPPCPIFGKCGGCQIMHLKYAEQLRAKEDKVRDALERIGKIDTTILPCIPSPSPLHYRNKIQLPVNEKGHLGLYARNSHDIVEMQSCFIHCALGEKVVHAMHPLIQGIPIKYVLLKTATSTNQVLVVLVTKQEELLHSLAQKLMDSVAEIKGVVQCINPSDDNTILSQNYKVLAGQGSIEDVLCGLSFKVSPASFFQVNPGQAELLYSTALAWASPLPSETVLDAYCGVGTLSLIFAKHCKKVLGIEIVKDAVVDARENAQRNQIANARFVCGKAEEEIKQVLDCDIAILNPPRKGCDKKLLDALIEKKPSRLLYISCDPATLARDLNYLCAARYSVQKVQPFDMFPQTMHVESLALCVAKDEQPSC